MTGRALRAFTWIRWRILVNGLRGSHRRDTIERVSRVAALAVPGLIVATSVSSVGLAVAVGAFAGWFSVSAPVDASGFLPAIRILLLVATLAAVLVPLAVGAHGGAGRSTRYLLLPLSARELHLVQIVAGVTDPWVLVLLPGLFAYGASMIGTALVSVETWKRSFVVDGVVALVGAFGVAAVLGMLASLVTLAVSWVTRDRRRSEVFVIAFVLALSGVAMIPALMSVRLTTARVDTPTIFVRLVMDPPLWMRGFPSELYGSAVANAQEAPRAAAAFLALLFGEAAGLYALSSWLHRLVLESIEGGRSRRRPGLVGISAVRLPGMWPGTSAVARAQLRTALRSVRGRLVVLLPGPIVSVFAIVFRNLPGGNVPGALMNLSGPLALGIGLLFGLYTAQAFTLNQFASDRAGLTLEFQAPIRDIDLIRGKAVGCGVLVGTGALLSLVCALAASPSGSPFVWFATGAGGVAAYIVLTPATAWLSVVLPVPADLSKTGMAGNPHSLAMLAATVFTAVAALPVAIALLVFSPAAACATSLIWLAVSITIAMPLLSTVARALRPRRENLALIAQGKA